MISYISSEVGAFKGIIKVKNNDEDKKLSDINVTATIVEFSVFLTDPKGL